LVDQSTDLELPTDSSIEIPSIICQNSV